MQQLVQTATERFGQVDVFCSNAGIIARADEDASNVEWQRHWDVNLMAHVYAARAVLPQMIARGEGYLVQTASAAGLLSQVNAAPYSVTKHAAVGFAEWLSIAHGDKGIRVSCLCPQGVLTPMLLGKDGNQRAHSFLGADAVTPEAVAIAVVDGDARRAFPRAAAPRSADLPAAQDGRLRPLAARHAAAAREGDGDGWRR